MSKEVFTGTFARARRELRRDEMSDFGNALPWLSDHSLIPTALTNGSDSPYSDAGRWMLKQFVDWSAGAHLKLDYQGVFDKYELSAEKRVAARSMISMLTKETYGPGIDSMSEIFEVVPHVAGREGVSDPGAWLQVAQEARNFAASFAKNGTDVQGLVRLYMAGASAGENVGTLQPQKLKLDSQTGITSVIPIERLIEMAIDVTEGHRINGNTHNVCAALQAPVKGVEGSPTMFDATWNAYGHIAGTQIYPLYTSIPTEPLSVDTEEQVYQKMVELAQTTNAIEAAQVQRQLRNW